MPAFGITPFAAALPPAPTQSLPIAPQSRLIGDWWSFAIVYLNPDGSAASMVGMPGAIFDPGYGQSVTLSPLAPNPGDAPNLVRFGVQTDPTRGGVLVVPQQGQGPSSFPVRLQAFLTDSYGHRTTYCVIPIVAADPATVDLTQLPPSSTIVGYAGPAGAQGEAGIAASAAQISAAVSAAIPGAVTAALEANGLPTTGVNFTAAVNAAIEEYLSNIIALLGGVPASAGVSGSVVAGASVAGTVPPSASGTASPSAADQIAGTISPSAALTGAASASGSVTQPAQGNVPTSATASGTPSESSSAAGIIPPSPAASGTQSQSASPVGIVPGSAGATLTPTTTASPSGAVPPSASVTGVPSAMAQPQGAAPSSATASASPSAADNRTATVPASASLTGVATVTPRNLNRTFAFGLFGTSFGTAPSVPGAISGGVPSSAAATATLAAATTAAGAGTSSAALTGAATANDNITGAAPASASTGATATTTTRNPARLFAFGLFGTAA